MKALCTDDWHLRFTTPKMRKDKSYFSTQFGKVVQILDIAVETKCDCILHGGDVFDSNHTPYFVIQEYIVLLKKYNIPFFVVRGQHDLRYHSEDIANTPLAILEAADVVKVVGSDPFIFHVNIYGASFNEPIPEPVVKEDFNILLIHRMIVRDKLWAKQEDYIYGKSFMRKYQGYDLIVSGDNHEKFVVKDKNKYLVNAGSMMRSRVDQKEHEPAVFVFDTVDKSLEEHKLNITKSSKILDWVLHRSEVKRNKDLDMFISSLKAHEDLGTSFSQNVQTAFNNSSIAEKTKSILKEWLEKYEKKNII